MKSPLSMIRSGAVTQSRIPPMKQAVVQAALMLGSLWLAVPGVADAQALYRIVGADGKVTFSDKPPAAENNNAKAAAPVNAASVTARVPTGTGTALPFELRQIAVRFPVTLYTSANCAPCGSARALLLSRGVPFTEKTVTTEADVQALKRLSNETSLPFATIGSQQLKGFSDAEWTQFINAAGYPAASVLPASYRAPAATPLVAVATAATAPTTTVVANDGQPLAAPPAAPSMPVTAPVSNPAGIKF